MLEYFLKFYLKSREQSLLTDTILMLQIHI